MQRPVVATAVGGIPEIVDPGVTGYLHAHGDAKQFAVAVLDLIEDPEKAKRMGTTAREHVRQNYSRAKFASEIARAYDDLLES